MKYYKKLIGERLYLSPVNLDDVEKYAEWLNDLEISLYLTGTSEVYTNNKEREILESLLKSETDILFAIINNDNELIGNIGLHQIDYKNRKATFGIFIGEKDYWNNGYGTEAIKLLLNYGFYFLNLHNINLEVYSYNERAISCYKKIGFKEIGRRRESIILGGKFYDEITMDILSNEIKNDFDNMIENFQIV
ncbi:GNAT family protein [Clostridiaceae bacterium HSG29]|nr:GNAT family protein [Clostridiaceae bacterium HSG29]